MALIAVGLAMVASIYVLALSIGVMSPPVAGLGQKNNKTLENYLSNEDGYAARILVRRVALIVMCSAIGCFVCTAIATPCTTRLCHRLGDDNSPPSRRNVNSIYRMGTAPPT